MTMNKSKTYQDVLNERGKDLETLILYFSVTRVFREPRYHDKIGGFSFMKFVKQRGILNSWKNKNTSQNFKDKNCREFAIYEKTFNETLGIPCRLIEDILGKYKPTGKRIELDEALNTIGGTKKWKVVTYGQRAYTDKETGERVVKDHYSRKIYPEDPKVWRKMLHDSRYGHIERIPNASKRAIEIIKAWEISQKLLPLVRSGEATVENIEARLTQFSDTRKMAGRIVTMMKRELKYGGN